MDTILNKYIKDNFEQCTYNRYTIEQDRCFIVYTKWTKYGLEGKEHMISLTMWEVIELLADEACNKTIADKMFG